MRTALALAGLVVVGLFVFELVMSPTVEERIGVAVIFSVMAAFTYLGFALLPRLARRLSKLRLTLIGLSAVSLVIVGVALVEAMQQMFISQHDLALMLIVVGFGLVAALAFAVTVSGPLTDDLNGIAETATAIAEGRLDTRTGVERNDEVGDLALAVDQMAERLEQADADRRRGEEARRRFFAAVGHDLRTPIASIRAVVEAMTDGVIEDHSAYLGTVRSDVEALSHLVDDIFLLARLESGQVRGPLEVVDLTEVADETIEVFRPLADRKAVRLRLDAEERVLARAGSDSVARVIRNLVDNAIRHSPSGGEVVLSLTNGARAQVMVTDQGPGLEPEFVERAFEAFTRADQARDRTTGGAGLGLAIARELVTEMGGAITATPGPGGRISVSLPGPVS